MVEPTPPVKSEAANDVLAATPGILLLLLLVGGLLWLMNVLKQYPPGTPCIVSKEICGVADLGSTWEELDTAVKIKDDFGLAGLANHERVATLPKGTTGLVIETSYSPKNFRLYRKVRILSDGPDLGKAFWVRREALRPGIDYAALAAKARRMARPSVPPTPGEVTDWEPATPTWVDAQSMNKTESKSGDVPPWERYAALAGQARTCRCSLY